MDDRFRKFKENETDMAELYRIRRDIEAMSDEELDAALHDLDLDDKDVMNLQHRLNSEINPDKRITRNYRYIISAAAVFIAVLISYGIYATEKINHYRQYDSILSENICITSSKGETLTTVLPDGSKIKIGPESDLSYSFATFNDKERKITYAGEGRFVIAKNTESPFTIMSPGFEIRVLGTTFSIFSRNNRDLAEIHLEEGSIELTATAANTTRTMKPGDTAVINKSTGDMDIYPSGSMRKRSAGKAMLYFQSEPLSNVLPELEIYYNIQLHASPELIGEPFTGAIPTDDLDKTILILEETLSSVADKEGGILTFRAKKHE